MERLFSIVSENQLIVIAVGFVLLLAVYFLFKAMLKIVLLGLIIVIAVGGYYYFQRPEACPSSVKEAISRVKGDSATAVEKGKELAAEGKNAYEKGKKVIGEGRKVVDKGTDIFEKMKRMVERIASFFETADEKGAEKRP